jgi:hypothetical protein
LVGPNALANGSYNLTGTLWITLSNFNPNDPTDNGDGGALFVNATMVRPLWPSVSIQPVGQWGQPKVTPVDQYAYAAWEDTWEQIQIPVEDGSNRVQLHLHAAIDQSYYSVENWHAVLPNIEGLDFWTTSQGGTKLDGLDENGDPIDENGDLIDQAFSSAGTFDDDQVWVSEDPTYAANNSTCPTVTLDADATIGDPAYLKVAATAATSSDVYINARSPKFFQVPTWTVNINYTRIIDVGAISGEVRRQVTTAFLIQTGTKQSDWDTIQVEIVPLAQRELDSVLGYSGILQAVKSSASVVHGPIGYSFDFSNSMLGFMPFIVVLRNVGGPASYLVGTSPVPAPDTTTGHELWHTNGVPAATTALVAGLARARGLPVPGTRNGYAAGANLVINLIKGRIAYGIRYPNNHADARTDAWALYALNCYFTQYYMSAVVMNWIFANGAFHDGDAIHWNMSQLPPMPLPAGAPTPPPTH